MQRKGLSPIGILIGSAIALTIAALGFTATNHLFSYRVGYVQAEVSDTTYQAPYTQWHTTTDSRGFQQNTPIEHEAEWHVIFRYQKLTYDEQTNSTYNGWKVGDHRQMQLRKGGLMHNPYLWPTDGQTGSTP